MSVGRKTPEIVIVDGWSIIVGFHNQIGEEWPVNRQESGPVCGFERQRLSSPNIVQIAEAGNPDAKHAGPVRILCA